MLGLDSLEVVIGLAFLFFILSLILSSARELIEGYLQTRAIHLERGIREMLKDQSGQALVRNLYNHPIVSSLFRGDYPDKLVNRLFKRKDAWQRVPFRSHLPAYIPAANFAVALLDIAARGLPSQDISDRELTLERAREHLEAHIKQPNVRRAVLIAIDQAKGDLEQAKMNIAAWFDSSMDRVSGWYRKETQGILIILGLLVAFTLNIDTLKVAQSLYENDALRSVIVADAQAFADQARAQGANPADQAAMLRVLGCTPELAASPSPSAPPSGGASTSQLASTVSNASQGNSMAAPASATTNAAASPATDANAGTQPAPRNPRQEMSCAERRVRSLGLPIGWGNVIPVGPGHYDWDFGAWLASFPLASLPGWLLTALAVSLGAPFWFDLLNKVMVIRSTVKPHEKSPEEASEDRQPARPPAPVPAPPAQVPVPPPPAPLARQESDEPNRVEADEDEAAVRDTIGKIDPLEDEQ